jgi:hypothetical protein
MTDDKRGYKIACFTNTYLAGYCRTDKIKTEKLRISSDIILTMNPYIQIYNLFFHSSKLT